jgi:hypothetical protein
MTLNETLLPHDESAEEALERACAAWHTARARLEAVDAAHLSPASRDAYYRMLTRIGLWVDARAFGADAGEEAESVDAE